MKKSVPRLLTHQLYTHHRGLRGSALPVLRTGRCAQSGSVSLPQISGQPGVLEVLDVPCRGAPFRADALAEQTEKRATVTILDTPLARAWHAHPAGRPR